MNLLPSELANLAIDSLLSSGGFSLDSEGQSPESGYIVSEAGSEVIVPLSGVVSSICNYIRVHLEDINLEPLYLGGWIHDGKLYLDLSRVYPTKEGAVKAAHDNLQLAIFDVERGEAFDTPPK